MQTIGGVTTARALVPNMSVYLIVLLSIRAYFEKYIFVQAPYFWHHKTHFPPPYSPEMPPPQKSPSFIIPEGIVGRGRYAAKGKIFGRESEEPYAVPLVLSTLAAHLRQFLKQAA